MKSILLSADNEISVFSVPDEVADHLEQYCMTFCCHWLHESPDAAKYRVKMGRGMGVCYNERDFIDYLNQYVCDEPATYVRTLSGVYDKAGLPEAYAGLPYFHF